jgi:hypothetical protein
MIVQTSIVNPKYQAMSFEINYSFGISTSFFIPIIAKLPEPIPSVYITVIATLVLLTVPYLAMLTKVSKERLKSECSMSMVGLYNSFALYNNTSIDRFVKLRAW